MSVTAPAYADFGSCLASVDVDEAVLATLQKWMPTYLGFLQTSRSLPFDLYAPDASHYANVILDDEWRDISLPAILVATARTHSEPEVMPDGSCLVDWLVAVSAVVRGQSRAQTRQLASLYELATRMVLVQQWDLGDFADSVRWLAGGEARPLTDPLGKGRWLGEGASQYLVRTEQAVNRELGPDTPGVPGGYEAWPEVTSIDLLDVKYGVTPSP
jgi:hypothetical protein